MAAYDKLFAKHGIVVAQVLLTHTDLEHHERHLNARNTLCALLEKGVVPIINENDSVAVEELKFGDNDRLSAEVAMLARADLLILLTSTDGLLDGSGKTVRSVENVDRVAGLVREQRGKFSVGGMTSKLQAVKLAIDGGIHTHIASGRKAGQIGAIVAGKRAGTRFVARGNM
jgi:glutamate 5-kinase